MTKDQRDRKDGIARVHLLTGSFDAHIDRVEVHVRRFGGRDRAHQMVRELMEGSLYTPLTLPSKEKGDQSMWGRPRKGKSSIF